jgi:hypothetical protein
MGWRIGDFGIARSLCRTPVRHARIVFQKCWYMVFVKCLLVSRYAKLNDTVFKLFDIYPIELYVSKSNK